jgi:hypothetical protein
MRARSVEDARLGPYGDVARVNRRRTSIGGILVAAIGFNYVELPIFEGAHHHATAAGVIASMAALFAADVLVGAAVRLKRWSSSRVIIVDLGARRGNSAEGD